MEDNVMERMIFTVPQMDYAAEEQLVRMKLSDQQGVKRLTFDIPARTVAITHIGNGSDIEGVMQALNLGAALVGGEQVKELEADANDEQQRKLLVIILVINAALLCWNWQPASLRSPWAWLLTA